LGTGCASGPLKATRQVCGMVVLRALVDKENAPSSKSVVCKTTVPHDAASPALGLPLSTEHFAMVSSTFATSRRRFLQQVAWGGGVSLLGIAPAVPVAYAAGNADALLLTCMDYRLMDDVERYMSGRGLRDKYDHVVLAGAALGAVTDKYPAWNQTFWDHLEIALKLHNVHRVIVIDHRDCGAYKVLLEVDHKDLEVERNAHAVQLKKLKVAIAEKHPKLAVESLLMALDGTVEPIR
jgi:hypothetical protein